ncbi:MAG: Uma2 family endonuclease [Gemmataceae bacterium]
MATATTNGPRATTQYSRVGDLITRLGGINPQRVYWNPLPGTATEADLLNIVERKVGRCELVERTLVEKPIVGQKAEFLAALIVELIGPYVRRHRLGRMSGSQGLMRMSGGNVRMPDAGFVSTAQLRQWREREPAVMQTAPALAIEVLSPSNTRAEMAQKRREYFASGSQLVWEIDPRRKTAAVYTSPTKKTTLTEGETLDGGDVIPGFTLPLAELFAINDD